MSQENPDQETPATRAEKRAALPRSWSDRIATAFVLLVVFTIFGALGLFAGWILMTLWRVMYT